MGRRKVRKLKSLCLLISLLTAIGGGAYGVVLGSQSALTWLDTRNKTHVEANMRNAITPLKERLIRIEGKVDTILRLVEP